MKKKKFFKLTMETKRNNSAYIFLVPWIIGMLLFFVGPFIEAVKYVFNRITIESNGVMLEFTGLSNLNRVFMEDPESIRLIFSSIGTMVYEVSIIIVFSLIIGIILNQKFKGRIFARAIFAMPIIISSGILLSIFKEDLFAVSITADSSSSVFQSTQLTEYLMNSGLNASIVNSVTNAVNRIFDLVYKSGVQILLFLAALQSIPSSLFEVCNVEGATAWQKFWKVTFPMISPYILLNIVYSIIDSFTYYGNPVMIKVSDLFRNIQYEFSATLSVVYFLFVLIIVVIVIGIGSKKTENFES